MIRILTLVGLLVLTLTGCRIEGAELDGIGPRPASLTSAQDVEAPSLVAPTPGAVEPTAEGSSAPVDVDVSTPVPLRRNLLAANVASSAAASSSTGTPNSDPQAYYANCDEVRAAGMAPLAAGDHGYRFALDRDRDGFACDVAEGANGGESTSDSPQPTTAPPTEEPDVTTPNPTDQPRNVNPDEENVRVDPDGTQRIDNPNPGESLDVPDEDD